MKRMIPLALVATVALVGCSQQETGEQAAPAEATSEVAPQQMAYGYQFSFKVPTSGIGRALSAHIAMCEELGLQRCRVLESHRNTYEGGANASLKMTMVSSIARPFGDRLAAPVEALGGKLESTDVQADDLGRQIVDGQARLRSKQMLVDRLNKMLATRNGTIAELVAAEKAVADAQGELDAARTQLTQSTGRVSMSPVSVGYSGTEGFGPQVGRAFAAGGEVMTTSVVALVYFLAAVGPWALVAIVVILILQAVKRRRKARVVPVA